LVSLLTFCTVIGVGKVSLISLGALYTVSGIFAIDQEFVALGALILNSVKVVIFSATTFSTCGGGSIEVLSGTVTGNTLVLILIIVFIGNLAPDTFFVESRVFLVLGARDALVITFREIAILFATINTIIGTLTEYLPRLTLNTILRLSIVVFIGILTFDTLILSFVKDIVLASITVKTLICIFVKNLIHWAINTLLR